MGGCEGDCPGDLQEEPRLHDEGVGARPREGPQVEAINSEVDFLGWVREYSKYRV